MDKKQVIEIINSKSEALSELSDEIWGLAELSLKEKASADLYVQVLEKEGFTVTSNISKMPTAFIASYGVGKPLIGILAEYDALGSLSQVANSTQQAKEPTMENGHGCGHNLLGVGSLAAAIAIKEYLKEGNNGTVVFYGCPGEEGGAGKAFMAHDGLFYDLDMALTWHPGDTFEVVSGTNNSSIQVEYTFTGIASHAAGDPHLGRSALDAVELMNVGIQFLREHMPSYARVHYAITDAGGVSPNVVQYQAKVLYMVRSGKTKETLELLKRVDMIANGAAMMTETKLSRKFIDGTSDVISNQHLEKLLYDNYQMIDLPIYSKEEMMFAEKVQATFVQDPYTRLKRNDETIDKYVNEKLKANSIIANFVMPYLHSDKMSMGSTDVGDVSYQTPTAQITAATYPIGSPGHSWQNVTMGKSSIAHKGMLTAGKVLALTAIEIYEDPNLLNAIKTEFNEKTKDGYFSPIEDGALPTTV